MSVPWGGLTPGFIAMKASDVPPTISPGPLIRADLALTQPAQCLTCSVNVQ